ncbi:MAG: MDR family MFS transporter [Candidatus Dormibacteraceae bacterium]
MGEVKPVGRAPAPLLMDGAAERDVDSIPWTPQLVRVMAGLMVAMFVAAMDATVVGTALPTIARELGGFSLYPWVFTGYLLTGTTTVPIWGRLADVFGRKRVLLAGLAIFVAASVLCGIAPSMLVLIAFRTLQGVGAGCLQPLVMTVVGDIFPLRQRARLQGAFSAMWALAAVGGPLLGAGFVSTIGWRWIFDINLPVGLVAAALIWGYRERRPAGERGRIDLWGALLLTAGIALLLWGLGAGTVGAQPRWPVVAGGAVLLGAFAFAERRSVAPTVPLELLRHRVIGPAVLAAVLAGTLSFGLTAYVPLYVQGALGGSPYQAGAAIAPMSLGWPVASVLSGRLLVRTGYRPLVVVGAASMVLGSLMLALDPAGRGVAWVGLSAAVVGFGMGMLTTPVLIVIQSSVAWAQRGAATALNQFSRTIGGAIGISLMGILLEARIHGVPGRAALGAGIHLVYWVLVILATATLVTTAAILITGRSRPAVV